MALEHGSHLRADRRQVQTRNPRQKRIKITLRPTLGIRDQPSSLLLDQSIQISTKITSHNGLLVQRVTPDNAKRVPEGCGIAS